MIAFAENTIAGREVTLGTIETSCQRYDVAANTLDEMITALEAEFDSGGTFTVIRGYDQTHRLFRGRHTDQGWEFFATPHQAVSAEAGY